MVLPNRLCLRICVLQVGAVLMGQADKVVNHFCLLDLLSDGFANLNLNKCLVKTRQKLM